MKLAAKRACVGTIAAVMTAGLVACGGGSSNKNAGTTTTSSGGAAASLSAASFTSDFSAMAQLKTLAAQGKGLVGVLLPDTTTSARYVSFDAPYLTKAFQTAGLTL